MMYASCLIVVNKAFEFGKRRGKGRLQKDGKKELQKCMNGELNFQ